MIFFQNEFCTITIDQSCATANVVWTAETINMPQEEFRKQQLAQVEATKKYNLTGFLIDGRLQRFAISPELQTWIAEYAITPSVESGLKKTAIFLPKEIFSQISVEQTMEETGEDSFKVQYFDNEVEAKKWLAS